MGSDTCIRLTVATITYPTATSYFKDVRENRDSIRHAWRCPVRFRPEPGPAVRARPAGAPPLDEGGWNRQGVGSRSDSTSWGRRQLAGAPMKTRREDSRPPEIY